MSSGAIWKNYTAAFTTSYDYGAPLSEDGRTTDLYYTLRDTIQKYTHDVLPEPAANLPRLSIPEITLSPRSSLLSLETTKTRSSSPLSMEALGQDYGFVLYEHQVSHVYRGVIRPGDRARDRVIVYVNGAQIGVIDSTYAQPNNISVQLSAGDVLHLLVENLGRVDYWSLESDVYDALVDPYKGIVGDVIVGDTVVEGWTSTPLPMDTVPLLPASANSFTPRTPTFYAGVFDVGINYTNTAQLDTFLAIPGGVKGLVWVNGFNLGRYCEYLIMPDMWSWSRLPH